MLTGVGGLSGGQRRDQAADVVGVRLVRLGRGQLEHLGRADRVPLGQERQRDDPPRLAPGGRPGDDVVGGPVADRAAQRHAGRLGPGAQRVQRRRRCRGCRRSRSTSAPVARSADSARVTIRVASGVGAAVSNRSPATMTRSGCSAWAMRDDVGEHRDVLVDARAALEDLADVPVGRVQDLHAAAPSACVGTFAGALAVGTGHQNGMSSSDRLAPLPSRPPRAPASYRCDRRPSRRTGRPPG